MIRTFRVQHLNIDENDSWSGILSIIIFTVRITVYITTQATASQLIFGRDIILNISYRANWRYIKDRKQKLIHQNNKKENAKKRTHLYPWQSNYGQASTVNQIRNRHL